MKDFPIALQLYSVRDDMAADMEATLKKVKAMGYDGVEFAGLFGKTAAEVKAMCKEIGLVPISAHVAMLDLMNDPSLFNVYKEVGCEFIVVPYLPDEYRPGAEKFDEVITNCQELCEKAAAAGLKLCYHNHDFEFVKLGDKYGLDILFEKVPDMMPELDCCWVKVSGEEPTDYIRKYAGREEILHLKDFVGSKSENMYALIGIDENEKKDTAGKFEFRPVGSGVQNFPAILEAAKEVGIKWVVVEQDSPSMGKTPMECAETSINYLNSL